MPALPATRTPAGDATPRRAASRTPATRFDRRLEHILDHATEVFCSKGYEGASMRDLSPPPHVAAGLYYYFESKERLLFLIQKHTFTTILEKLKARLADISDPSSASASSFRTTWTIS